MIYLHLRNTIKRFIYNYVLRDVSLASVQLPIGLILSSIGTWKGLRIWINSWVNHIEATAGDVVFVSFLLVTALQLLLSFLAYDISNTPKV